MRRFILIGLLFSGLSFAGLTDYMKDSLSNIDQNLALKYYSTQERGYLMGGSWFYRTPQFTIYPFSITPPSIKAGCGGIDIIMGGFSYVQPEYLVQVLQTLIQNAPAVAFEIALDTFAPQVKGIVNDINSMVNQINSLNFKSCQALNGIKAYVENNLLKNQESTAAKGASEEQSSGSSESFFSSISEWYNNFSKKFDELKNKLSGKPLKSSKGSSYFTSQSLVADALANTQIGVDSQIAALIRGILGDINPSNLIALCQGTGGAPGYIPPATTNLTEEFLTKWLTGTVTLTGIDSNGNPVLISYTSIKDQILRDLQELYNLMASGQKPNPQKYLYLTYADVPVVAYLKLLSAVNDPTVAEVVNDQMADLITLSVVHGTIKAVMKAEVQELQSLVNAYKQQYGEADCVADAIAKDFKKVLQNYQTFMQNFSTVYWKLREQKRDQIVQFMNNYKQLQQILYKRVSEVLPEGAL